MPQDDRRLIPVASAASIPPQEPRETAHAFGQCLSRKLCRERGDEAPHQPGNAKIRRASI
jgi:hypothetical protein